MPPSRFLRLEDFLLPLPLPAVVAVLIVAGLGHLGWRLARRLRASEVTQLDVAAGFILVTAAVAALVHGLAMLKMAWPGLLRTVGWGVAALGLIELFVHGRRRLRCLLAFGRETFSSNDALGRIALALAAASLMGLFAAALGPPTDADSLSYHLGVPLEWLRYHGVHVQRYWLTMRLVGLGESLNMLGLASGTDVLGASLQAAGVLVAMTALLEVAREPGARLLAVLLVAACPVLLFLVPNQKPQMLPAAALTTALVLFVTRRDQLDQATLWLAWGSAAFAIGSKYSFILTGAVLAGAALLISQRARALGQSLAIAAGTFLLLAAPVFFRNFMAFGDPLSPNFEKFRAVPDAGVVAFAEYLRTYGVNATQGGLLRSLAESIFTVKPEAASTALGVGAFAFVIAVSVTGTGRWLLGSAVLATVAVLGLGQVSSRFLLEPYLWGGAAAVFACESGRPRAFRILCGLLTVQAGVMAAMAIFGAVRLFPGALSPALRDHVMTATANGYAETRWLASTLDEGAVVLSPTRSYALVPRPFSVFEVQLRPPVTREEWERTLCSTLKASGTSVAAVLDPPPEGSVLEALPGAKPLGDSKGFRTATRNPFNAGVPYAVRLYDVSAGCR